MIEMDPDRRAFEELIPFYVNGTLSPEDKQFMQNYLMKFPTLKAHIDLSNRIRSALEQDTTQLASAVSWQKLLKQYQTLHKKLTLTERFKNICIYLGLTPAFAVVLSLFIAQSAAILQLGILSSSSAYRGLSSPAQVEAHLKVTVNPQTDYAQLVDLLRKNGCRVVAGPSETGELWLQLEAPEKLNTIKADLLNSGLVDEALSIFPGTSQ
ncbi:MAG: hypothetical protein ACTS9Y_03370 [Methylophilus sp.]|uniref:hypothetical protein n=1 Tax=Methylophilus sp. TaxID=29541 RepID=UPI003F9FFB7A